MRTLLFDRLYRCRKPDYSVWNDQTAFDGGYSLRLVAPSEHNETRILGGDPSSLESKGTDSCPSDDDYFAGKIII